MLIPFSILRKGTGFVKNESNPRFYRVIHAISQIHSCNVAGLPDISVRGHFRDKIVLCV